MYSSETATVAIAAQERYSECQGREHRLPNCLQPMVIDAHDISKQNPHGASRRSEKDCGVSRSQAKCQMGKLILQGTAELQRCRGAPVGESPLQTVASQVPKNLPWGVVCALDSVSSADVETLAMTVRTTNRPTDRPSTVRNATMAEIRSKASPIP